MILGPLTASEDWAKKTKVKVRITNKEMMSLWKLAMIEVASRRRAEWELSGTRDSGQDRHSVAEKAGALTSGGFESWHLRRGCRL